MELMPQFVKNGDNLLDRKYAAMHHLSMNVTKWLNIGLFESVVFGRKNRFDFEYLNPIIFLRHIEGTLEALTMLLQVLILKPMLHIISSFMDNFF